MKLWTLLTKCWLDFQMLFKWLALSNAFLLSFPGENAFLADHSNCTWNVVSGVEIRIGEGLQVLSLVTDTSRKCSGSHVLQPLKVVQHSRAMGANLIVDLCEILGRSLRWIVFYLFGDDVPAFSLARTSQYLQAFLWFLHRSGRLRSRTWPFLQNFGTCISRVTAVDGISFNENLVYPTDTFVYLCVQLLSAGWRKVL